MTVVQSRFGSGSHVLHRKARTFLSSVLRHAAESEAIPGNPLSLVRAPGPPPATQSSRYHLLWSRRSGALCLAERVRTGMGSDSSTLSLYGRTLTAPGAATSEVDLTGGLGGFALRGSSRCSGAYLARAFSQPWRRPAICLSRFSGSWLNPPCIR